MKNTKYSFRINRTTDERSVIINRTGIKITEREDPETYIEIRKKAQASQRRKERDEVMKLCGLTKVKGSVSGKTYWE